MRRARLLVTCRTAPSFGEGVRDESSVVGGNGAAISGDAVGDGGAPCVDKMSVGFGVGHTVRNMAEEKEGDAVGCALEVVIG